MKAIKLEKPYEIEEVEIAMPQPKAGEALIRVKSAGICGSDIGAYRGTNNLVTYPRIIGHEIAGEVLSIPENEKGCHVLKCRKRTDCSRRGFNPGIGRRRDCRGCTGCF